MSLAPFAVGKLRHGQVEWRLMALPASPENAVVRLVIGPVATGVLRVGETTQKSAGASLGTDL